MDFTRRPRGRKDRWNLEAREKGTRIEVDVDLFEKVPAWARRKVERETERLAVFLDGEPLLKIEG